MTKLKIARTLEWFDIVEYNETNYPGLSLDEAIELEQNAPKQYLIGIARTRYNGVRHRSKVTVIDKVMPARPDDGCRRFG